jgi:hypothetical protein
VVVVEPRQIESLGFRLSVVASLALVVVLTGLLAKDRTSRFGVILTATVAAQLATLPVLLPTFGTVSLTSVPANILAVPLVAIAMPLAALAAIAGLFWQPLGEAIAAPAALAATTLIGVVDVLGAPQAYISVGVPPLLAAAAIAAAVLALLFVISGNGFRGLVQTVPNGTRTAELHRRVHPGQPHFGSELGRASNVPLLPPSATWIVAGKDPLDALAAHLDEAEKQPSGEEIGHELADVGQTSQAVAGQVAGHLPEAHPRGQPENDDQKQQRKHEHLPALAHDDDVLAAKVVEP